MLLPLSFFVTAILYAAVGFGGGSTYNALLVLAKTDYRILPTIALLCNLIVVSGGTYRFHHAGYVDFKRIAPWIIPSVPAAWLGGYLNVSETFFVGLLGFSLFAAGIRLLWPENIDWKKTKIAPNQYRFLSFIIGTILGFLAGIVGIGGGIFLAPILYFLRWDSAKKIAATCSVFILVNSLAGLIGQIMKLNDTSLLNYISEYWILFPAVLIGGQIGSYMSAKHINPNMLRLLTSLLILYVAIRLLWQWIEIIV